MDGITYTDSGTVNVLPEVAIHGSTNDRDTQFGQEIRCETTTAEAVTTSAFRETDAESIRVLVADDDPLTLRLLKAIVEAEGYQAVTASNGQEVIDILKNDDFFMAALFDMWMPHAEGMDLIRIMKSEERLSHIPVALMSSERDLKIWGESAAAGASMFLPKPFSPSQVQMTLRMLASKQITTNDIPPA